MIPTLSYPTAAQLLARAKKPQTYAVIYASDDGRVEVRYRRHRTDTELAHEVLAAQRRARKAGQKSPYSISTDPQYTL